MRFGYMPSFKTDLLEEIDFAKKYFDFIEITLKRDLTQYHRFYLKKIKNRLSKFEILGHLHWEIDLRKREEIKEALRNVEIYIFLGARKITIHPSENYKALIKIADFCKSKKVRLLIENTDSFPFSDPKELKNLLDKIPSARLTLDIGHAINYWSEFLKLFPKKINHIHLHYNNKKEDHLPFNDDKLLKKALFKLAHFKKRLTVSLEIFKISKGQKVIPLEGEFRRKILIKQLERIKKTHFL